LPFDRPCRFVLRQLFVLGLAIVVDDDITHSLLTPTARQFLPLDLLGGAAVLRFLFSIAYAKK
jgi:hypothetical protein